MIRRFVHLIVDDLNSSYTLRRIDTTPLFAGARKNLGMPIARPPPRPVVCFDATGRNAYHDQTEFFLLGSKIVSISKNRRTIMYDTSTSTICAGPSLRHSKGLDPAWAAVQGKLYLVNAYRTDDYNKPCFEALRFDGQSRDWVWELLPSPTFSHGPFEHLTMIISFAAAGDGRIWVSTRTATRDEGTYTFDITAATWRKEGDWALPFQGQLQYIPDYNLCFGFCKESSNLCTADLIAAGGKASEEPPRHVDVWEDFDGYDGAKGWHLAGSYLTYLGSGRFCVTRFYDTRRTECYMPLCDVAVMTGVEVKHSSSSAGELQLTKRASRCYKFAKGSTMSGWAF
ncbi:hypothetical protein QYE76_070857 [Lolium multiflorum]|uniref:Uncharacterized protein n=1 Tax=Lolium multiflorum TaxID=4521 RepID=A0AAD8SKY8_LOLMU|nr:hypothetical protein QYE76_070857 [Lolium multiflorum]